MTRFFFSPAASADMEEILQYLRSLPVAPAQKIGRGIQETLTQLAAHPAHGIVDDELTELARQEFRRYCMGDYVFVYAADRVPVEFFGVLHGRRDIRSIMQQRLR